jgi:hypothetical protein
METGNRVTFLDRNGQGGWKADEEVLGQGKTGEMGEFEMFGEELDSDEDGLEGGEESFRSEQREVIRDSRGGEYEDRWRGGGRSQKQQQDQQQYQEKPSPRVQGRRKDRT